MSKAGGLKAPASATRSMSKSPSRTGIPVLKTAGLTTPSSSTSTDRARTPSKSPRMSPRIKADANTKIGDPPRSARSSISATKSTPSKTTTARTGAAATPTPSKAVSGTLSRDTSTKSLRPTSAASTRPTTASSGTSSGSNLSTTSRLRTPSKSPTPGASSASKSPRPGTATKTGGTAPRARAAAAATTSAKTTAAGAKKPVAARKAGVPATAKAGTPKISASKKETAKSGINTPGPSQITEEKQENENDNGLLAGSENDEELDFGDTADNGEGLLDNEFGQDDEADEILGDVDADLGIDEFEEDSGQHAKEREEIHQRSQSYDQTDFIKENQQNGQQQIENGNNTQPAQHSAQGADASIDLVAAAATDDLFKETSPVHDNKQYQTNEHSLHEKQYETNDQNTTKTASPKTEPVQEQSNAENERARAQSESDYQINSENRMRLNSVESQQSEYSVNPDLNVHPSPSTLQPHDQSLSTVPEQPLTSNQSNSTAVFQSSTTSSNNDTAQNQPSENAQSATAVHSSPATTAFDAIGGLLVPDDFKPDSPSENDVDSDFDLDLAEGDNDDLLPVEDSRPNDLADRLRQLELTRRQQEEERKSIIEQELAERRRQSEIEKQEKERIEIEQRQRRQSELETKLAEEERIKEEQEKEQHDDEQAWQLVITGLMMYKIPRSGQVKQSRIYLQQLENNQKWYICWDSKKKKDKDTMLCLDECDLILGTSAGLFTQKKWKDKYEQQSQECLTILSQKRSLDLVATNSQEYQKLCRILTQLPFKHIIDPENIMQQQQ